MSEPDDRALLRQLRRDPAAAMRVLLTRYGGSVKGVVQSVLGASRPQDVEECVADAFIRLWQRGGYTAQAGTLKAYLCGIARNAAIDRRRAIARQGGALAPLSDDTPAPEPDFEDAFSRAHNTALVRQAVQALPSPDREIFERRYFRREREREIAAALGLTEKQVRDRLYRGRKRLRKTLEEGGLIR